MIVAITQNRPDGYAGCIQGRRERASMDFDQLRYFISVAQTLNFTQAAKLHYITQPAISRRITELEKELDTQLFIRSSHCVVLTSAGEEFFHYALSVLDMTASAQRRVHNIAAGQTGRIKISAVSTSDHVVNQVLSVFTRRCPEVQIDLDFSTGMVQMAAINKGEYDFYFSFQNLLQSNESLSYLVTDQDRFHLFVPNELAHLVDVNNFSSLSPWPLITEARSEGPYLVDQMFAICRAREFDTKNIIACNDFRTVVAFANAGMGFTMFPRAVGRSVNTDHLISFSVPGDDALTTNAVGWNPASGNNAATQFLTVLKETYSPQSPEKNAR